MSAIFGKEYVEKELQGQMPDELDYFILETADHNKINSSALIPKEEVESTRVYDPNDWNPYPTVTPPVDGKKWLTQDEDGSLDIRSFVRTFEEGIDYSWENQDDRLIVAFRSLPPLYTRDEQIDN